MPILVAGYKRDSLTEDQVIKVRKKGAKQGRSCQHPRCDCNDYKNTSTGIQASWLAKCTGCRHTDSDHRIQTRFDKLRAHHMKNAATSACVGCAIKCQGFSKPDDSISQDSPLSKQCTLCSHSIENHRPYMENDDLILSVLRENISIHCQKMLEKKTEGAGKCEGYDIHDWFEAVNVDPDERQDMGGCHTCYCRGMIVDDPARICHVYYGLLKEIVQPHLLTINCQRCSHALSDHRKLTEEEQTEKDVENECKLTLLTMAKIRVKNGEQPIAMYTPDDQGSLFALARVMKNSDSKTTSLRINVGPTAVPQTNMQVIKDIKRKRTNSGKILDAVKSKFKKRKMMNTSDTAESDELRSDESLTCSDSDSSFTKLKKKFKQKSEDVHDNSCASKSQNTARNRDEFMKDVKTTTPGDQASTVVNMLMDSMKEMVVELPKPDVKALAWGKLEGNTDLFLAVGFQDGSVMFYTVTPGSITELVKCKYEGKVSVSRLLWVPQDETQLLAIAHADGKVNIIRVTANETSDICTLENGKEVKVTAIAASPSGSCVCVGQQDGSISFYMINSDGSKPMLLSTSSLSYGTVQSLAWHPSKNIAIAAGEDDHVTVFYMETLADRKKDKTRGTIMHYLGKKRRFDLDVFTKCCKLKGHLSFVGGVTFDPAGAFLISVGWDGQILFWDTTDIDDIISCGAGDVSTIECSTGYMIGQRKFRNFPSDGMNFMPLVVSLAKPVVYVLAKTDSETLCLVAYQVPKKYR